MERVENKHYYLQAVQDFRQARRKAALERIIGQITGKSTDLLSYDDVRQKLKASGMIDKGLHEIPLDAIVGSVGRYSDFTRTFLPKQDSDEYRWANVQVATTGLVGLPPIIVYKINDSYFVKDGNHRVSVARQSGASLIEAYVTEVKTKVALSTEDNLDDLIRKAGYADFLERTNLSNSRPDCDLLTSAPGKYWVLEAQIEAYCLTLSQQTGQAVPFTKAAEAWYDKIYRPIKRIIRKQGILRDFPHRTATDLYIWLFEHRAALREMLGWDITPEETLQDISKQYGPRLPHIVKRLTKHVLYLGAMPKTPLADKQKEKILRRKKGRIFSNILVEVTTNGRGRHALDQALMIARQEEGRVRGLYVFTKNTDSTVEQRHDIQKTFNQQHAHQADIHAELAFATGKIAESIIERSVWADLLVVPLNYPPSTHMWVRFGSNIRTLIRQSPRPILVIPQQSSPMRRALLAYDGSPKAKEGAFLATYMAVKWGIELVVLTIQEGQASHAKLLGLIETYMSQHGIKPEFVQKSGPVAQTILQTGEAMKCDFFIMGGYGYGPLVEALLGSSVDYMLRESTYPVLICR